MLFFDSGVKARKVGNVPRIGRIGLDPEGRDPREVIKRSEGSGCGMDTTICAGTMTLACRAG